MNAMNLFRKKVKEFLIMQGYTEEEANTVSKGQYDLMDSFIRLEQAKSMGKPHHVVTSKRKIPKI